MTKAGFKTSEISFNPVKGCENFICPFHPRNKGKEGKGEMAGKCWAAGMCRRWAEQWAEAETEYIWPEEHCREYKEAGTKDLKKAFKKFEPVFLESIYTQPFPKKPSRIAAMYMTDFAEIPIAWTQRVIDKIELDNKARIACGLPLHRFQFLTKNPIAYQSFTWPYNCQLGFTATNQPEFDTRFKQIHKIYYGPQLIYAYLEPLLEKIDITAPGIGSIEWVVVGGGDIPVNPDWVRDIRDACVRCEIPFFFKGFGKYEQDAAHEDPKWKNVLHKRVRFRKGDLCRRGPKTTLDGVLWQQFPEA